MRTNTANKDLREAFIEKGLFMWQVARRAGVSATTLTMWMREELPPEDPRRKQIIAALEGTGQHGTEEKQEAARVSEV